MEKHISHAKSASLCKEWQLSVSNYSNKVEAILDGEPEHLMITLQKIIEANQIGDLEKVHKLGKVIKSKAPALSKINPPEDLVRFHRKLINYHKTTEKAFEAIVKENIDFQSIYTRRCYETLLDYFQELKALLIEKECDEGDIAALKNTIIPGIENILRTKLSEEAIERKRRLND